MNVLVSVGTHEQQFQRLLDIATLIADVHRDCTFRVQYGVGRWQLGSPNIQSAAAYLTSSEMQTSLAVSDVLISQASPGLVFAAVEHDTIPLIVGRRRSLNEHVDDHQVAFGRKMAEIGIARAVDTEAQALEAFNELRLAGHEKFRRNLACYRAGSASRTSEFRRDVWSVIEGVGLKR